MSAPHDPIAYSEEDHLFLAMTEWGLVVQHHEPEMSAWWMKKYHNHLIETYCAFPGAGLAMVALCSCGNRIKLEEKK